MLINWFGVVEDGMEPIHKALEGVGWENGSALLIIPCMLDDPAAEPLLLVDALPCVNAEKGNTGEVSAFPNPILTIPLLLVS
jgi:hypothetical protein